MGYTIEAIRRWLGIARVYRSSLDDEIRHCVEFARARVEARLKGLNE